MLFTTCWFPIDLQQVFILSILQFRLNLMSAVNPSVSTVLIS